jgi:hypothetical protein
MELTKKQKIQACVGNVKRGSIPLVTGCSSTYVSYVLSMGDVTKAQMKGLDY